MNLMALENSYIEGLRNRLERIASLLRQVRVPELFYLPLLHRPTPDTLVADGLHLCDEVFSAVVLLICAIGAQYSGDQ